MCLHNELDKLEKSPPYLSQHELRRSFVSIMSDKIVAVGCGLPRTGTTSLKLALEELLGGQCYHMYSFIHEGTQEDLDLWGKAFDGKTSKRDWVDFFKARDFKALVDFPPAYFYKELMTAFPKAKVILTTRTPSSWHDSVIESTMRTQEILAKFPANVLMALNKDMSNKMEIAAKFSNVPPKGFKKSMFQSIRDGKDESAKFNHQWTEDVRRSVPKDQLLEFDVKQGWQPLCDFLGVPVPNKPFPRANDREQMAKEINKVRTIGWIVVLGTPIVLAGFIYLCLWAFGVL